MIIESSFPVRAPAQQVWDFLIDPTQMVSCVPGCSKVERVDDNTYRATMSAKVAYITFSATMDVAITRMEPPHELESVARGEDKRLGSNVQIAATLRLTPQADGVTEVAYRADVSLWGKLGALGEPIFRQKATQTGREFAACVKSKLETAS
jgi:carbon monoxide dehydrogenase subunit G